MNGLRSRAAGSSGPARRRLPVVLAVAGLAALATLTETTASKTTRTAAGFPGGGYFNLACGFSHRNNDDPILYPGQPGRSHNHTFIGNESVDASTTTTSLRSGATTCELDADRSTYWVPTLYAGREPILPLAGVVYYVKLTPQRVVPFPRDLKIVAGNMMARRAQPPNVVSWSCGGVGGSKRFPVVQGCSQDEALELRVQFPDCWNGKASDSANHKRHMAYSRNGRCPATHPVAVPTLMVILLYPPVPRSARPASGKFGAHADFMNGWDEDVFAGLVSSLNYS